MITLLMQVLQTRLNSVLLKRSGIVLVLCGEPGIGKTHRAKELLHGLSCKNFSFHATVSLSSILLTLPRPLKLPLWTRPLFKQIDNGDFVESEQCLETLSTLLAALAPILLHLEDVHEVNSEQHELLTKLAERIKRSKGVALLVTSRTPLPEPFEVMRLEPLDEPLSARLLQDELKAALPNEASSWIYQKARGNPLFTLEYLRYLTRTGNLWNDGRAWHWRKPDESRIPSMIEALIEKQLSDAKETKDLELIIGARALLPRAEKILWAKVANIDSQTLEEAIELLIHKGIFQNDTFIHPLYREVAERSLTPEQKRLLARRAVDALSSEPRAAAAFVEMAALDNDQARDLFIKAAKQTKKTNNQSQAGRFLAKACDYMQGEERARLAFEAANLLLETDLSTAQYLAVIAVRDLQQTESNILLARIFALQGQREAMQQTLSSIPESDKQGLHWLKALIQIYGDAGDNETVLDLWNTHRELQNENDPEVAYQVAAKFANAGQSNEALEVAQRALEQADLSDESRGELHAVRGNAYFYASQFATAQQEYSEALRYYEQTDGLRGRANVLRNRATARLAGGQYQESVPDFEKALQLYAEQGNRLQYAETQIMFSDVFLELGNYERTEALLLDALETYEQTKPDNLIRCLASLSMLYQQWRSPHSSLLAFKYAKEALQQTRDTTHLGHQLTGTAMFASACTFSGDAHQGLESIEKALPIAHDFGVPEGIVNCLFIKAQTLEALGKASAAKDIYQQSYDLALETDIVIEAQKIGLELDRLNKDTAKARERLVWFEERGLLNGANIARRYFPELTEVQPKPQNVLAERLEVLGAMQFSGKNIQGNKRQGLLALLLEARIAGRNEVSKLRLFDELYPDVSEDQAAASLKKTVSQIRSSLGQAVIQTTSQGYALGAISSDAEEFLKTLDTLLWRGVYLEGLTAREESVREALYQALKNRCRELLETNPKEVTRVGRILLEADPYDQEALSLTLQAMRQSDNHKSLVRLYDEAKTNFAEVSERLPEHWQEFLRAVS